jgi:hypothetical protein
MASSPTDDDASSSGRLFDLIHEGEYEACRRVLAHAPQRVHQLVVRDGSPRTALMCAVLAHTALDTTLAISRLLLDHRADVNATADHTRWTVLHAAVERGCPALVRLLCERGAMVNAPDLAGNSPLHLAAIHGDATTARVLLAFGADVERPDHAGRTPLHLGVASRFDVCRLLIAHRADVNAMDVDRFTPLDTALLDYAADDPTVTHLVDAGATTHRMARADRGGGGTDVALI